MQLSALDRILMETLYDPRMQPAMTPETATMAACRILAEKLGVAATDAVSQCGSRAPARRQLAAFGRR
jgi:hypothetical protein